MKPEPITEAEVAAIEQLSKELLAKLTAADNKTLGPYLERMGRVLLRLEAYRNN